MKTLVLFTVNKKSLAMCNARPPDGINIFIRILLFMHHA